MSLVAILSVPNLRVQIDRAQMYWHVARLHLCYCCYLVSVYPQMVAEGSLADEYDRHLTCYKAHVPDVDMQPLIR